MVNYKTRVFWEPDTNSVGADIIIYSDSGDVIDTILVTTESTYQELAEKVENIDNTYIDTDELHETLLNVTNALEINATKFQGLSPSDFAPVNHQHTNYAPVHHSSITDNYGPGTSELYGHNKIINNLNSSEYKSGEALSAYQGNVLNQLIQNLDSKVAGENIKYFDNPTKAASSCKIALKRMGNIVFCQYHINYLSPSKANLNKDILVSKTKIPEGFRPINENYFSVAEYNSNNNMLLFFTADGSIYCRGYKQTVVNVYGTTFWFVDLKFWE